MLIDTSFDFMTDTRDYLIKTAAASLDVGRPVLWAWLSRTPAE